MRTGNELFETRVDYGARFHALSKLLVARTCRHFEFHLHRLLNTYFYQPGCFFLFLPAGAEIPAYVPNHGNGTSRRRYRDGISEDQWFKRHPPEIRGNRIIRHSDHTPTSTLSRSRFFKKHLKPHGYYFGATMVFWDNATSEYLGCATMLRPRHYGDFSDIHLDVLKVIYEKYLCEAVERLAEYYRLYQEGDALRRAWYENQEALLVISRNGRIVAATRQANRILSSWGSSGAITHKLTKMPAMLPETLRAWCTSPSAKSPHPIWNVEIRQLRAADRSAGRYCVIDLGRANGTAPQTRWNDLTNTERSLIVGLTEGKTNGEIARDRGTATATVKNQMSSVLKKTGLKSRVQLAVTFAKDALKRKSR